MKLRQKLAMVLASAMIVTAVPVVTMAQSTALNKPAYSFIADTAVTTEAGLSVVVNYDQDIPAKESEYVTVKSENFEFNEDQYKYIAANTAKYPSIEAATWVSKTEVEFKLNTAAAEDRFELPLAGTPKKGTPVLTVSGTNYTADQTITLGELETTKAITVDVADATNISLDGEGTIGKLVFTEQTKGALKGDVITVELPNSSDLIFDETTVTLTGKKGLKMDGNATATVAAKHDGDDEQTLIIDLSAIAFTNDRAGVLEISGIAVEAENPREDVETGEVEVEVSAKKGDDTSVESKDLVVATVAEEAVDVKISEEDVVMTAGHGTKTVEVVVKETLAGSLSRDLYIEFDGAKIEKFDTVVTGFDYDKDSDGNIVGIVFDESKVADQKTTEHKVKVVLKADADAEGVVTLIADGKDLEDAIEKEIATVEAPFEVEGTGFNVETGIRGQKGGEIVITEAEAGKFDKNSTFVIKSEDEDLTIEAAEVDVTGDVEVKKEVKDGQLIITVTKESDEVSEIVITDIEVDAAKYLAEGSYDFVVGGTAVAEVNKANSADGTDKDKLAARPFTQKLTLEEFVVTGEATISEELAEGPDVFLNEDNRLMAKLRTIGNIVGAEPSFNHVDGIGVITFFKDGQVIQFVNGSNIMSVNGVDVPMDTETVIAEDNYTYVPARFLAEALGLSVEWNPDTRVATFTSK